MQPETRRSIEVPQSIRHLIVVLSLLAHTKNLQLYYPTCVTVASSGSSTRRPDSLTNHALQRANPQLPTPKAPPGGHSCTWPHRITKCTRTTRRLRALNLQPLTTQPRLWQRDQRLTLLDFNTTSMTKVCASSQRHATWPTGPRPHRRSATLHSRLTAACVPTTECKPASLPLTPRPSPLAPHPSPLTPRPSPLAPRPSPLTPRPSPFTARPSPFVPLSHLDRPSPLAPPLSSRSSPPLSSLLAPRPSPLTPRRSPLAPRPSPLAPRLHRLSLALSHLGTTIKVHTSTLTTSH